MSTVNIEINGKKYVVPKGITVARAAKMQGIYVPSFSERAEDMGLNAPDRKKISTCLINGELRPAAGNTYVEEGMVVVTESEEITAFRKNVLLDILKTHSGDCIAPCQRECPTHIDVMGFLNLAHEGRFIEALETIKDENPIPLACGFVCPAFCEQGCRRHLVDSPVAINAVKRYCSELNLARNISFTPPIAPKTGKRVAIIGAGPAGLTCAYYLTLKGHSCTIFEMNEGVGGMMRYGIPEYRLPKAQLDKEVYDILRLGIELKLGQKYGRDFAIEDLKKDGFDLAFFGIGCWGSSAMRIRNEHAEGVVSGIDFLAAVERKEKVVTGDNVIVVGGGNTAIDAARTAVRLGAKRVTIMYRRSRNEMPAFPPEVVAAEEEGVELQFLNTPQEIMMEDGKMVAMKCVRLELGEPDSSGRRRPVEIPGSEFIIEPSLVIAAIGQFMAGADVFEKEGIPLSRWKTIQGDETTGRVNDFVYTGGDCLLGACTVIQCIGNAKVISYYMDAQLRNMEKPDMPKKLYEHVMGKKLDDVDPTPFQRRPKIPRQKMPELDPKYRRHNTEMVDLGFTKKQVLEETKRCLQCGCTDSVNCELRHIATYLGVEQPETTIETAQVDMSDPFYKVDTGKCVHCGHCIDTCSDIRHRFCIDVEDLEPVPLGDELLREMANTDCESCGSCVDVCPVNCRSDKRKYQRPEKVTKTICPYCGCGCSLKVGTRYGKIVNVVGDPTSMASHGQLCVKGRYGLDFVSSHRRLLHPLIRDPTTKTLVEVSWGEALDFIARKLKTIKSKYGSRSIAGLCSARCSNEDNYIFQKFIRGVIGTNSVDHCARLCHASTVSGLAMSLGSGAMTNTSDDLLHSKCIIVIGSNTSEAHPIIALRIKKAVHDHGATLIVIDPRSIELTKFAKYHLRQRSGSDVAVINAIMNVILTEELHNPEFIEKYTENFEEARESIMRMTPELAAAISGVEPELIRQAAREYAKAETGALVWAMGITQHATGTDNVLSLANLAMITGHVGRLGAGLFPLRGQNNVQGACDMGGLPDVFTGYQKVFNPEARAKMEKEWQLEEGTLDDEVGLTVTDMIEQLDEGKLHALYVMGENPAISDPNVNHFRKAVEKTDLLVVQDIFLTETAKMADIVLPSASALEKDGTVTNTERRVQLMEKVCDIPGDARLDWEIICDLAWRMGYKMHYDSAAQVCEEIARVTPSYGGIVHSRLQGSDTLQWPCPNLDHPGTPILHKDGKFSRGKGKFYAVEFRDAVELPDYSIPGAVLLTTGRVLQHYHTGTMTRKSHGLNVLEPRPFVEVSKEDAEALGIEDGEYIRVKNTRGAIVAKTRIRYVAKGTIFIPFHFHEGAANKLTIDAADPIAKIPELKVCAAYIEKLLPEERVGLDDESKGLEKLPTFESVSISDVTAVVVVNRDKKTRRIERAFMPRGDTSVIEHILTVLRPIFEDRIMIVTDAPDTSRSYKELQKLGVNVVTDMVHEKGAIGNVYTGLVHMQTKWGFFLCGNMLNVREEFIHKLVDVAGQVCTDAVIPVDDSSVQSLHALYTKDCAPFVKDQIDEGDFKVCDFYSRVDSHLWNVPESDYDVFEVLGASCGQ
eukprot:TRINITY_DN1417_c1_g5_i1.p1 TRINITY_DN1417_c1_g5~~TRINITY_DN1417_c1_g5_i1.p1  ORF type:complete len:1590 (-),score=396.00 TRINITY_DN1417_c1_g5_i1:230-4999(-)